MTLILPDVNPDDSAQNAFVQDWLTAYFEKHSSVNEPDDWRAFESIIEIVQETYDYRQHHGLPPLELTPANRLRAAFDEQRRRLDADQFGYGDVEAYNDLTEAVKRFLKEETA